MSSRDACSFEIMLGIAMLTIVKSSRVIKNPSETTIRMTHGLPPLLLPPLLLPPPGADGVTAATAVLHSLRCAHHATAMVRHCASGISRALVWAVSDSRTPFGEPAPGEVCSGHENQRNRRNRVGRRKRPWRGDCPRA